MSGISPIGAQFGAARTVEPLAARIPGSENIRLSESRPQPGFLETTRELLDGVNELQHTADDRLRAFVRGEAELHDVAIASHEAGIALRLTREIRDRLLMAYQEVMRMQM